MRALAEPDVRERLRQFGQEQLLRFWPELSETERSRLLADLEGLDLALLDRLIATLVLGRQDDRSELGEVRPIPVERLPVHERGRRRRREAAEVGAEAIAAGEVAVVIAAGGQGTRLGFPGPKGTYPIGPVSGASLFQLHAEKILALSRRFGGLLPLFVMTSPGNYEATTAFFAAHESFGLGHVCFFRQGQLPAVDRSTGKILLAERGRLALSPDGHGGTLTALAAGRPDGEASCLAVMRELGVRTIFYLQVDNPLTRIAEPAYLGLHRQAGADISFKVVVKQRPHEKVGLVAEVAGRPLVIEYSDLPEDLADRRDPDGKLELWAGNIATHVLERDFLERLVGEGAELPYHRALKRVRFVDAAGRAVEPFEANAVKFERFIFDALPAAERYLLVEAERAAEFAPLKDATGDGSPAVVQQRLSELYASWLEDAGVRVPRGEDGSLEFALEISPLFATDAEELAGKLDPGFMVDGPLYLR